MADVTISQLGTGTPTTGIVVPWSDGTTTYQAKLSSLITATGDMGSAGIQLPKGTTAQRVNTPGQIRFNSSTNQLEFYNGTSWRVVTNYNADPLVVSLLLVGGGGGGSVGGGDVNWAGGGSGSGGGGVLSTGNVSITNSALVTIGQGGLGAQTYNVQASNGTATYVAGVSAYGGIGGYSGPQASGTSSGGNSLGGQGYPGGSGGVVVSVGYCGGGGGGAGGPGANCIQSGSGVGAAGGVGTSAFSIIGAATNTGQNVGGIYYYAGGGGGAGIYGDAAGGAGGGGAASGGRV